MQRSIRLTPAMWVKIDQYGIGWLRSLLERARGPKALNDTQEKQK